MDNVRDRQRKGRPLRLGYRVGVTREQRRFRERHGPGRSRGLLAYICNRRDRIASKFKVYIYRDAKYVGSRTFRERAEAAAFRDAVLAEQISLSNTA